MIHDNVRSARYLATDGQSLQVLCKETEAQAQDSPS